jgi:hypothetical protein
MGLADDLEQRLERVVEGFFSRAFRSKVQPAEIGRRLLREQESGKSVSVDAVYVPNHFRVRLAPQDYERFGELPATLSKEFADLLKEQASERRWLNSGPIAVTFEADESLKEGRFAASAEHKAGEEPSPEDHQALLRLAGDESQMWTLTGEVTIGRESACDVRIVDGKVSRRHAQLEEREDGWWVTDLGSTNHTYVNASLVKEARLSPGDRISVGDTELIFEQEDT